VNRIIHKFNLFFALEFRFLVKTPQNIYHAAFAPTSWRSGKSCTLSARG